MKKLIMAICLFSMTNANACSECIKILCKVIQEYEANCDPNYVCQTPGLEKYLTYDKGMVQGLRCAIINIERIHPECRLTMNEYETIVGKRIEK